MLGHIQIRQEKLSTQPRKTYSNFKAAGEILEKVLEEIVLDNFPVVANHVEDTAKDPVDFNEINVHCRISQYLLQMI